MNPPHPLGWLGAGILALPAAAQDPVVLVLEGDDVPGVGAVTRIDHLEIGPAGNWLVEADTDHVDTDADSVVLLDGALFLREGQALPAPAGATLDSFDSMAHNSSGVGGFNFFLDGTSGSSDDSGIYLNTTLLIQESDLVASPLVSPGTPWIGFFDVKTNDNDQLLVLGTMDDVAIASSVDQILVRLDVTGGVLAGLQVIMMEGDVPPGQTQAVATFSTNPHGSAFNDSGNAMFVVDMDGDTATDGAIYIDGTLLAQEGSPSPIAGRNWSSLSSAKVGLNNVGDHVYSGTLDGDAASNLVIVKNGAKFVQEGDSLPDFAPFLLTSFGSGPVHVANDGKVLWFGDWDDPNTAIDTGLFIDGRLIVQEGVTQVGGVVVQTLRGIQDGYALHPSGESFLFEGVLADGNEGVFLVELGPGSSYCISTPNSTGLAAQIHAEGSASVAANDLTLVAEPVPAFQNGIFFYGPNQVEFVFGNGFLCAGGGLTRFPVVNSGAEGVLSFAVDNTMLPPGAQFAPGVTWNFQAWFRDPAAGGAAFDTSDGLTITFTN